ncbi:MAG TPA: ATP-binding protein [Burkholderiaceae bacterium]
MHSVPLAATSSPDALAAGPMARAIAAFDWSLTPLGPAAGWPASLQCAVRLMLGSRYPMFVWWGPRFVQIYNDAYAPLLGRRHPGALGRPAPEVWADVWDVVGPQAESVLREGRSTWNDRVLLVMQRRGYTEEAYFTFSYGPAFDDAGRVGGVFATVTEDTERVLGERRLRSLRDLSDAALDARSVDEACQRVVRALSPFAHDLPFLLIYLADAGAGRLRRAALAGIDPGSPFAPEQVDPASDAPWPFADAAREPALLDGLAARMRPIHAGAWPEPVDAALVLPLPAAAGPAGFVVAGLNQRRALDDAYRDYLALVAQRIAGVVAEARAFEDERRQAEALAEIDRAKTAFFTNVSHEFRTPLALMLGPLADLAERDVDPEARAALLDTARRNAGRLLKLVNTLLDFARVEGGRADARFEPTDLARLCAELASNFRAACERAGLQLVVDCPPLPEPVWVDRELWEKVVLNLLSNAFKFTHAGSITVRLRALEGRAELAVADTGTGIAADDLPRLFNRFQRLEATRGRSFEGSGIGLALAAELVKLHGGTIRVDSEPGRGSTFTVSLPLGQAHLPADRLRPAAPGGAAMQAGPYVEEALRWLPPQGDAAAEAPGAPAADAPTVLVADDNRDLREYLEHLLGSAGWRVTSVADGAAALRAVREHRPDLVLADVMMPTLDGFGLLAALRADDATRSLPVILLSARAGEEARIEGLAAGADDYLVKPFAAAELRARVAAHLAAARVRAEAEARVRASEQQLRLALEAARAGAWSFDPVANAHEWSPELYQLLGVDPADPDKVASALARIAPDEREALRRDIQAQLDAGGRLDVEFRIEHPEHGTRWLELRGHRADARLHGIALDVTERHRDRQRTRQSDELLRETLLAARAGAWAYEEASGTTWWSAETYRLLGVDPAVQASSAAGMLNIHPEDAPTLMARREEQLARDGRVDLEYRLLRPDGSVRWLQSRGRRLSGGRVLGITIDISARKQAEQRERDREAALHLALEAAQAGTWDWNPATGVTRFSPEACRMFGIDPEAGDVLAASRERIHPDDRESTPRRIAEQLAADGEIDVEYRILHPVDGLRWVHGRGRAAGDGRVLGVLIDVTERKRTELALRDEREYLRAVVDQSLAGIAQVDLEGVVRQVNARFAELLGRRPEELAGVMHILDVTHPDDRPRNEVLLRRLMSGAIPSFSLDKRYLRPDGTPVWVSKQARLLHDAEGRRTGLMVMAFDIDERKRAERAAAEARDALTRQVADLTLLHEQAMRTSRSRDIKVVLDQVLAAALKLTGKSMGSVMLVDTQHDQLELVATIGFDRRYRRLVGRLARGAGGCGQAWATRKRIVVEDARVDPLFEGRRDAVEAGGYRAAHCTPLIGRDGAVLGVMSLFDEAPGVPDERETRLADMMARQAAAAVEMLALLRALEEADRRKDEFLATLAHELRNPLAPIRNALHLLGATDAAQARERLHEILDRQVNHMVRLVDDLMEASRISRGAIELRREPLDLRAVLAGAVEASRPLIDQARHTLALALPEAPLPVDGDAVRLTQVFANLLNNAARYTDPGGRIELVARPEDGSALVTVRDSGIGIAAAHLPRLFEMFGQLDRSTERAKGGLGIGLALVRRLVQMHGGSVEAASEGPGCGAKFSVRLPLAADAPVGAGDAATAPGQGAPLGRRVLVVDDNRDAADSLALLLEHLGAEVQVAHDGAAALAAFERRPADAALLDLGMPGMDGLEVARRLRALPGGERVRLIALTGWGQAADRARTHEAGFDEHLVKPVDIDALQALLATGERR